jgi:hypothetical protein
MTTKKILIIVAAVVLVIGLIVVVFVGGIIGVVFYSIGSSEAAQTARDYLRTNERLKEDIGEIKDFGKIVTGNVQINNGSGTATINLKVIGERQTVNASVDLIYRNGRPWQVTAASYQNDKGQPIELLNPYKAQQLLQALILKVAA